jgi:hypothetical protein
MATHWWHTHRLVEDLAQDRVTERESLRYAMWSVVIAVQTLYYAYWFGGDRGWLFFIEFGAVCVICLIGLHECFKSNGGTEGAQFLKRLFCLGVPVGLKLAIASAVVGQIVYFGFPRFATPGLFRDPYFVYQLASFFMAGSFTVVYYWRIAYHMAHIARTERSNTVAQSDALRGAPSAPPHGAPGHER